MISLIDSVKKLIEDGKGDTGRLSHILVTLESGKSLYSSDGKYLQSLLSPSEIQSEIQSEIEPNISSPTQVNSFTITTTNNIEGSKIVEYLGIVSGEAVMGANIFRDMFAGIRDIIGGRSGQYEKKFRQAKEVSIKEMIDRAKENGANAVVGVSVDYEMVGESMMMVSSHGTAVKVVSI
jgi:uncharacterized protein YbjQ (UPF0145 family)